jgi:hypothetical protein
MKNFLQYIQGTTLSKSEIQTTMKIINSDEYYSIIMYDVDKGRNYSKTLKLLENISPSRLKYSRKKEITLNNNDYKFMMSDCHIEFDFNLLGVNETNVFIEVMNQITHTYMMTNSIYTVVLLNFECIKKELLKIMYSFMKKNMNLIILTTQVSFIPDTILENSYIKRWNREKTYEYQKNETDNISNKVLEPAMNIIKKSSTDINLLKTRNQCYEFLVKNYDVHVVLSCLVKECIIEGIINDDNIINVMYEYAHIIEKFNNNYRSIFHIEKFMSFLMSLNANHI